MIGTFTASSRDYKLWNMRISSSTKWSLRLKIKPEIVGKLFMHMDHLNQIWMLVSQRGNQAQFLMRILYSRLIGNQAKIEYIA